MVTPIRSPRPSRVVPPGFGVVLRAALVDDRRLVLGVVRELAEQRAANGGVLECLPRGAGADLAGDRPLPAAATCGQDGCRCLARSKPALSAAS